MKTSIDRDFVLARLVPGASLVMKDGVEHVENDFYACSASTTLVHSSVPIEEMIRIYREEEEEYRERTAAADAMAEVLFTARAPRTLRARLSNVLRRIGICST